MNKFSDDIMVLLRKDLGLESMDTSEDILINRYSVNEAYKHLLKFGYYSDFKVEINPEWPPKFA